MKKQIWLILAVAAIIVFTLGACAAPAPTQAPAPAPAPAPTAAPKPSPATTSPAATAAPKPAQAAAPQWNLRFPYHGPPTMAFSKNSLEPFARKIEQVTNNRVKVTTFPAETLCKAAEQYDFVAGGVADLTWQTCAFNPGRFPVSEILTLPFLGVKDGVSGSRVLMELYAKYQKAFDAEYKDVKLLCLRSTDPSILVSNKPVRKVEELKGMKIFTTQGTLGAAALQAAGAVPITGTTADLYPNMEKKVVDGLLTIWSSVDSRRLFEVAKYYVEFFATVDPSYVVMNLSTWNSFPKDIQDQIMSISGLPGAVFIAEGSKKGADEIREKVGKMADKEIIVPSADEMAKLTKMMDKVHSEYLAKLEAKGLPAKAVYADSLKLIEKYK